MVGKFYIFNDYIEINILNVLLLSVQIKLKTCVVFA